MPLQLYELFLYCILTSRVCRAVLVSGQENSKWAASFCTRNGFGGMEVLCGPEHTTFIPQHRRGTPTVLAWPGGLVGFASHTLHTSPATIVLVQVYFGSAEKLGHIYMFTKSYDSNVKLRLVLECEQLPHIWCRPQKVMAFAFPRSSTESHVNMGFVTEDAVSCSQLTFPQLNKRPSILSKWAVFFSFYLISISLLLAVHVPAGLIMTAGWLAHLVH